MKRFLKTLFLYSTSYNYSNLSRLFIRLFVGVMFLQFGIRQIITFQDVVNTMPMVFGMSSHTALIVMIALEIGCSLMIMLGFLTRIATIPAMFSLLVAVDRLLSNVPLDLPSDLGITQPVYLPIMFIGIFTYLLLAGPGKISLDYLISLHLINRSNEYDEDEKLKSA